MTFQKNDTSAFLRDNVLRFIQALLPDYDNPAAEEPSFDAESSENFLVRKMKEVKNFAEFLDAIHDEMNTTFQNLYDNRPA